MLTLTWITRKVVFGENAGTPRLYLSHAGASALTKIRTHALQCFCFQNEIKYILDTLIQKAYFDPESRIRVIKTPFSRWARTSRSKSVRVTAESELQELSRHTCNSIRHDPNMYEAQSYLSAIYLQHSSMYQHTHIWGAFFAASSRAASSVRSPRKLCFCYNRIQCKQERSTPKISNQMLKITCTSEEHSSQLAIRAYRQHEGYQTQWSFYSWKQPKHRLHHPEDHWNLL